MEPRQVTLYVLAVLLIAAASSCSGSSRGQGPVVVEPEVDAGTTIVAEPEEPPPSGPRAVAAPGTFAALVSAANVLDERGEPDSGEGCLLRRPARDGWPWMLEADVAAAVRPLPEPPEDLDARLTDNTSPALVISRWGQHGSRNFGVALAAFTSAPPLPERPVTAVVLTNRGAYVRVSDRLVSAGRTEAVPPPDVAELIGSVAEPGQLIFVTAEAEIPLDQLRQLLAVLPEGSPVGLAVALGEEIHVPDPPPPPQDRGSGLCPDGLPDLPANEQGQLETSLLSAAITPFRRAAQDCMAEAAGTRAAGGLVELIMRIGPEGAVTDACVITDEMGGTVLRACLINAATATRFPAPRPAGSVDVRLPLRMQPSYQRTLCD